LTASFSDGTHRNSVFVVLNVSGPN
jgi:hypothetical protein